MHLPLDDHRVDLHPAVVHGDEPADRDLAGARVHVGDADVRAEREGEVRRVVDDLRIQVAFDLQRQLQGRVGRHRDLGDALGFVRVATDPPLAVGPLQVVG